MPLPLPSSPTAESASLDEGPIPDEQIGIEELFRSHAPAIAAVGLGILQNREEADDLVQDVFLRAWRALPRLQRRDDARPWLMTIAIRLARTRLRRRKLHRLLFRAADADVEQVAAPGTLPEHRDLVKRLYGVLNAMPADMHVAWVLRYVHGETVDGVAAACGCSPSTAKRRIQRAHERINAKLAAANWVVEP